MVKTPWLKNFGDIPPSLNYFKGTMFESVKKMAGKYPDNIAFDFMGKKTTYREFINEVERCAKALCAMGIRTGDRVTLCMPNAPQTVIMLYAVNLVGGISNMVHPLSAQAEIENYIRLSDSVACLALDQQYGVMAEVIKNTPVKNLIITSVADGLSPFMKAGYAITEGRKIKKLPKDAPVIRWKEFLKKGDGYHGQYKTKRDADDPAVILYSGGTTGKTKGILLSNFNFNALGEQVIATNPMFAPGDKMLAVMPMFHGFGLGVCIHTMLQNAGHCILIPRFNVESYARLLEKHRPNFIAGVPTLFEALLRLSGVDKLNLDCLKGVFSGGDSLSIELKKRFDAFLKAHNAKITMREGYGTTECVTASCLTPAHMAREGSIGLPFPDMYYKIVAVGTEDEVPYGEQGEICLSGPTVMLEYYNDPEETKNVLKTHADGLKWVHTGDLGTMDEDGFIYFKQRLKRVIVTSGYNVFPSQIENVLDAHELVHMSCVIGVPDELKMQKVKAFVMLKQGVEPSEETKQTLLSYCRKNVARYAMPYDIEFRESLPTTLVGKVAYRKLEEEEIK